MFRNINEIIGWCNVIIPTIFDDSLSYLEMVGRLKHTVNELVEAVKTLSGNSTLHDKQIEQINNQIKIMEKKISDLEKGYSIGDGVIEIRMFAESTIKQLQEWVEDAVDKVAKFVTFGLTDDGYFCAYIPKNWKDVEFDTSEKGELILKL